MISCFGTAAVLTLPRVHPDGDSTLTGEVIGASIAVHREIGPGEDEIAYEHALSIALAARGISHQRQLPLPLQYKGRSLDCGYRIDTYVEDRLPLELKAVATVLPLHQAQLLTYLRLKERPLGLLINFDVPMLRSGIKRTVCTMPQVMIPFPTLPIPCAGNDLVYAVLQSAQEVHRTLGPGLLRSAYEECLCSELSSAGMPFVRKHRTPIKFLGSPLPAISETPLVVAGRFPVMSISASSIATLHVARLLGQLRRNNWSEGLIINFNAPRISEGIGHVLA